MRGKWKNKNWHKSIKIKRINNTHHLQPDEHFGLSCYFFNTQAILPQLCPQWSLAERALAKRAVVFFLLHHSEEEQFWIEGGWGQHGGGLQTCHVGFLFEVQLKADIAYYPPSLKNLLGIRRLGQGWPRSLRACTQETLFLEPVTTITAVRQTK